MALRWQCGCAGLAALKSRHLFGMFLLLLVDFIWVGSAGLTKYLFDSEGYDKPLFTVYFKTSLFSIYLLPFLFWKPWLRLCCIGSRTMRSSDEVNAQQRPQMMQVQKEDEMYEEDAMPSIDKDSNIQGQFLTQSSPLRGNTLSEPTLGPSEFTSLSCGTEGNENHKKSSVPVATETASATVSTTSLDSRSTHGCPMRGCRVRFCQTVEVKHVPHFCQSVDLTTLRPLSVVPQAVEPLAVKTVVKLAAIFGILWFFANYFYALALEAESVAVVNILSGLSGAIVLVLAAIPFPRVSKKDRFTLTKLIFVTLSIAGAVIMEVSPSSDHATGLNLGAVFAIGGAILYGCYLVFLTKSVPNPDALEIPMFFGFVGVFIMILFVPLIALWDYVGWEKFQFPVSNYTWTLLLVNGLVGTVLSELFWLWGCLLTSSLVGTLSLSLVTPLSILYSIIVGKVHFSILFFFGSTLTLLAFVAIAVLDHTGGWDPAWLICKHVAKLAKDHMIHEHYGMATSESRGLLSRDQPMDNCSMHH